MLSTVFIIIHDSAQPYWEVFTWEVFTDKPLIQEPAVKFFKKYTLISFSTIYPSNILEIIKYLYIISEVRILILINEPFEISY